MKIIHLDAKQMETAETAHAYLADMLGAPSWYGQNLDALWDLLGDMDESLLIVHRPVSMDLIGEDYSQQIKKIFQEATQSFSHLQLEWREELDIHFERREPSQPELSDLGILFHPLPQDEWLLAFQGPQLAGLVCVRDERLHWLYSHNPWIQSHLLRQLRLCFPQMPI